MTDLVCLVGGVVGFLCLLMMMVLLGVARSNRERECYLSSLVEKEIQRNAALLTELQCLESGRREHHEDDPV
jgi:hypothetical protein